MIYFQTSWELSREKLVLEEKPLGEGHFGEVYKGRWIERDKKTGVEDILTVAVKTLKDATNEPEAFKQEADVMTKIKVSHTGENDDQTSNIIYTRWQITIMN